MDAPRLTVALTFDHDAISDSVQQFIAAARALPGREFGRLDGSVERWQAGPAEGGRAG
jgi:hypothetical protein